jgi:hypothetical protein
MTPPHFCMFPPHFCMFVIISPLKRTWPFILTIYNPLYPRKIYTKFDWNWPAGSREEDFLKFQNIFTLLLLSPLGEGQSPLESPLPKDHLCQVWSGSGEEVENVKVYRQTDGQMDGQKDDGQKAIRKAHLSFQLRWAKNLIKISGSYAKQCRKTPRKTVTCVSPIVINPRAHNSETIGVTTMKRELNVQLKPQGKFQVPIWNGVEKYPGKLLHAYVL